MLRCVSLVLAIAFSVAGGSAQEKRPAKPVATEATKAPVRADVRGVWKVTSWRPERPAENGRFVPRRT